MTEVVILGVYITFIFIIIPWRVKTILHSCMLSDGWLLLQYPERGVGSHLGMCVHCWTWCIHDEDRHTGSCQGRWHTRRHRGFQYSGSIRQYLWARQTNRKTHRQSDTWHFSHHIVDRTFYDERPQASHNYEKGDYSWCLIDMCVQYVCVCIGYFMCMYVYIMWDIQWVLYMQGGVCVCMCACLGVAVRSYL